MKNKTLFSILTLIAFLPGAGLLTTPTFAEVAPDGQEVWTVSDLLQYAPEAKAKREAVCGSDIDCQRSVHEELFNSDLKYATLENFNTNSFILTAINPQAGTLRVVFHDEDAMMRFWFGEEMHYPLTEAYIVWLEPDTERFPYVDYVKSGRAHDGMHVVYAADLNTEAPGWFPPNQEVEISAPNAQLELNTTGSLAYSMINEPMGGSGSMNYSSCLSSPYYQPGMECRLVFSKTNGLSSYQPFSLGTDNPGDNSTDEPGNNPTDEPDDPIDVPTDDPSSPTDLPDEPSIPDVPNGPNDNPIDVPSNPIDNLDNSAIDSDNSASGATDDIISNFGNDTTLPDTGEPASHTEPSVASSVETANISSAASFNVPTVAVTQAKLEPSSTTSEKQANTSFAESKSEFKTTNDDGAVTLPRAGAECNQEKTIFPWWFIILVVVCDALLMWLFWPNRQKHKAGVNN